MNIQLIDKYLIDTHSLPEGWGWFKLSSLDTDVPDGFIKVIGGIFESLKSGKNKCGQNAGVIWKPQ